MVSVYNGNLEKGVFQTPCQQVLVTDKGYERLIKNLLKY